MQLHSHLPLLLAWISLFLTMETAMSAALQTYIVHLDPSKISFRNGSKPWHEPIFASLSGDPSPELLYLYGTALRGFAARLTPQHLSALRNSEAFLAAHPDELLTLHTTYSPQFLGLTPALGLWAPSNLNSDVIIGVVDTGIWPEHASFNDSGLSAVPTRWHGTCEEGTQFSAGSCNKKLIGARAFYKGYEAVAGKINPSKEYLSARDQQGHGTHTASTAGGGEVPGADMFGLGADGPARGMSFTARLAAYKTCWSLGCANSDILAAVDSAVADGVDVLSLSLGGHSRPYYADDIAVAAFGAVERGVLVSTSAGNSGPEKSSVSNTAPWMITVAASYTDRAFPTVVNLGDGRAFLGASLYPGVLTKGLPMVYGATAGSLSARYCLNGSLSPEFVKGKIVLCDRGVNGRTEKGETVKHAGGAAVLLLNSEDQGEELFADAHVLPASSLGITATAAVKGYYAEANCPTASITFLGTMYGAPAPKVAAFSSRGPGLVGPDIIKPDIAAPGINILAAWPPNLSPSQLETDDRRVDFNILSGTSMSCPHVSGLAALLKSAHPDWSPAAIKSALMTTAYTQRTQRGAPFAILDISSGLPATPFAFGSGHVDPERAASPGLVYDISPSDYLRYLCGLNYTSEQVAVVARNASYNCSAVGAIRGGELNYPSFSVLFDSAFGNATAVHSRTVTNVGPGPCTYEARVSAPDRVSVTVNPRFLVFGRAGQKLSYNVNFVRLGERNSGSTAFGEVAWVCGAFSVRSPIAVVWE